ncbi:oxidoreductase [Lysinibacillus alkalisoli]|uniref:Oxidoreductase n=1 Tax=Lysinibacillus alkalisoli TaxID=1911548 RepID=A0A917G221_9BACI|nr:NAD(P)H-binding protein [Lysinibacillus alkalisoli]GGG18235.1 oxidoreductase [Lysinibacillus alkalisoli]
MKIALFGVGRTGRQVIAQASEKHTIQALVRSERAGNAHMIIGDATDSKAVNEVIQGCDVVISALGTDQNNVLQKNMALVVQAMTATNVQRIIVVSTAAILNSKESPQLLRYQTGESKRRSTTAAEDHHTMFTILQESTLDWTLVCPTALIDGDALTYRMATDYLPENPEKITRAAVASCVLNIMESNAYQQKRIGIAR